MPNLHQIIAQMQKELFCPVCGKNYEVGKIKLRGFFDRTLMIQTTCIKGHTTLFVTKIKEINASMPIKNDDIVELYRTIRNFDGDFQKLWKQLP